MHDLVHSRKVEYFANPMQPHATMMWHGQSFEPHFFHFIDDLLRYITHLGKGFFHGGI
jgi:hypothetical protein